MKITEIYINSFLDRLVNQNDRGDVFSVLFREGTELKLSGKEMEEGMKMFFKIQNLQIPNILPNFTEKFSKFFWESNYDTTTGVGNVEEIQIDTNIIYSSPAKLRDELNTKIQAVDADLEFLYNEDTKKITLKNNNLSNKIRVISSFRYALSETVITNKDLNDRIGFSQDLTGNKGVVNEGGGELTGSGPVLMNRTNNYHLVLEEAMSSYKQTLVPSKPFNQRVICNVPVGSYGTLSTLSYLSSEWFSLPSGQPINVLTFRILDDEFDPIELPANYPITLSLQIKIDK